MKIGVVALLLACVLAAYASRVRAQAAPDIAACPADRLGEGWWAERHLDKLAAARAQPDAPLLLIGDSITHNYDKHDPPDEDFAPTWQQFYGARGAINLGFSGDTTAEVLWRLGHGEVDGLHPKVVLLLIGTNNTGHAGQTAGQAKVGIDAVIADLELRLPEAHILLLGLLPSGVSASKTASDRRLNDALAASYGEHPRVTYLDIGSVFMRDGALDPALYYDPRLAHPGAPLHPDTRGQRLMAEAIEPTLAKLMGDAPRRPLAAMTDVNTAVIPVDRLELDSYDWTARHHDVLALQRRWRPRVVLLGDSITHFWAGLPGASRVGGPLAWQSVFGDLPTLNLGFGWDRTQNLLWRLRQGEFDDLHPEWTVLLIGTNNLTGSANARANTPAETVDGIAAVVDALRQRAPDSRLVLMALLPRGAPQTDPLRAAVTETNRLLALRYGRDPTLTYLNISTQFLSPDGSLPAALMPDGTHPSEAGYRIWADALRKAGVRP